MLAAALADIDRCESEPELARAINVEGAHNVARECARRGARLLFVSTGAVFDGEADRYTEESRTNPLSVYGKTKGMAEWLIRAALPRAVIARLSLVLGFARQAPSNAMVDKLRVSFEAGQTVSVPAGEYRNAIDVATACRWLLDLAAAPVARGVFHLGSSDAMSRYEIVRTLAETMGHSAERVIEAIPAAGRAPRGRHHLLVPGRLAAFSGIPVPTCRQAVERCVHAIA
jgi:dTDP-4-dehydrorhamnose reductase